MLVAREDDLEMLASLPNGFYMFYGKGGIGKTALMKEFAEKNGAVYIGERNRVPHAAPINYILAHMYGITRGYESHKGLISKLKGVVREDTLIIDDMKFFIGLSSDIYTKAPLYLDVFKRVFLIFSGGTSSIKSRATEVRELSLEEGREAVKSWGESEELADIAYERRGYMDLRFAKLLILERENELADYIWNHMIRRPRALVEVALEVYKRGTATTGEVAAALRHCKRKVTYYFDYLEYLGLVNKKILYRGDKGNTKMVWTLLDRQQVIEGLELALSLKKEGRVERFNFH